MVLYQAPPLVTRIPILSPVLGALLGDGRSSRLYKRLVRKSAW